MSDMKYWEALAKPFGLQVVGYRSDKDVVLAHPSGFRSGATAQDIASMATTHRNQIIQELIENAKAECRQDPETGIRGERKPGEDPVKYGVRLKHAEGAVAWLKSQMEGGE